MPKHLFIINPVAGGGRAVYIEPLIKKAMEGVADGFEIRHSQYPGHAIEIVAGLDPGEKWRVYACGGDGTLNEIARGAVGRPNVAITHYPCGTGNDFIKIFKDVSAFLDIKKLVNGYEQPIDCIDLGNNRYAINICSAGVDADVAADMSRFKWAMIGGSKAPYNLSLIYNVLRGVNRRYQVELDGERMDGSYCMLTVCNGQTYGGGFHACPDAVIDDNLLDFLLVKHISRVKLTQIVGSFAKGGYADFPEYITYRRGKQLKVRAEKDIRINFDGEIYTSNEVTFKLSEKKVCFFTPSTAE